MNNVISGRPARVPAPPPAPLRIQVSVVYSVLPGRQVLEKHFELSLVDQDDDQSGSSAPAGYTPGFTVRSVQALKVYSLGEWTSPVVAYNAVADFHAVRRPPGASTRY